MTADNDINAIFEKNTIGEVEELLSKMRHDIERKKEDLRIMVGERYRDLIEAADTVTAMRSSVEAVCTNAASVRSLCESLQQRGLIGFKTRVPPTSETTSRAYPPTSRQYSLAIQVKVLVDVPEMLWALAERQHLLEAAQLLLVAQQAHTALQLSPDAQQVLAKFPVIGRQWAYVAPFRGTIASGCRRLIRDYQHDDLKVVLEAVAAMVLLEGEGTLGALQSTLRLRREALAACLERHMSTPSAVAMTTLPTFVSLFITSLRLVCFVFAGVSLGDVPVSRLEETLLRIGSQGADPPPISLLYESSPGISFLPKAVVDFRATPRGDCGTLNPADLRNHASAWYDAFLPESSSAIAQLLSCTASVKGLSLVRGSVMQAHQEAVAHDDWNEVTESLLGKSGVTAWEAVIRQEALAQARRLVQKALLGAHDGALQMVNSLVAEIETNPRARAEEADVGEFLWTESASDLPDQGAWASSLAALTPTGGSPSPVGGPQQEKMGLFYKSRGLTKRTRVLCRGLNARVGAILEDVAAYAPEDTFPEEGARPHGVDYVALLDFLEKETAETLMGFLAELESIATTHLSTLESHFSEVSTLLEEGELPETSVVLSIARLCRALPRICPQVRVALVASLLAHKETARRVAIGAVGEAPQWVRVSEAFVARGDAITARLLVLLVRRFVSCMAAEFSPTLGAPDPEDLLTLFAAWERVEIEEESESGAVVRSTIRIPAHPSPPLATALARVCTVINAVCAHTLSRASQSVLVTSLCSELATVYEAMTSGEGALNQAVALQLIFDLQLLTNVLLPRENKEIGGRFAGVMSLLEGRVDPFDLHVTAPHLSTRVKAASQRLLVLLGTLIPREKTPLTIRGRAPPGPNNALLLTSPIDVPRFANVPVSAPPIRRGAGMGGVPSLGEESPLKEISRANETSGNMTSSQAVATAAVTASRSAASSLFSAVSSSWFGGAP